MRETKKICRRYLGQYGKMMTNSTKEPKCKSCKQPFVRYNTIQRLCVKCAIEKVKQGKDKAHRKELKEGRERKGPQLIVSE